MALAGSRPGRGAKGSHRPLDAPVEHLGLDALRLGDVADALPATVAKRDEPAVVERQRPQGAGDRGAHLPPIAGTLDRVDVVVDAAVGDVRQHGVEGALRTKRQVPEEDGERVARRRVGPGTETRERLLDRLPVAVDEPLELDRPGASTPRFGRRSPLALL